MILYLLFVPAGIVQPFQICDLIQSQNMLSDLRTANHGHWHWGLPQGRPLDLTDTVHAALRNFDGQLDPISLTVDLPDINPARFLDSFLTSSLS